MYSDKDPIVAISTAAGRGGIGIVRLSFEKEKSACVLEALFGHSDLTPRYAHLLPFADADEIASWALPAAKAMYALGIMTGNGGADGTVTFDAASTITRAQAVTMLGRIQEKGYASADLSSFPDSADVPSWAESYMETMYAQGILAGSDGRLNPNGAMTRGQACKILYMMW